MPGVPACGRCGTSLRLATAVMDVHPPRASLWRKKLRGILPARIARARVPDSRRYLQERAGLLAWRNLRLPLPDRRLLGRMLVPGWAHYASGQPNRGRLFLGSYAALLGLGCLFVGTTLGAILLGLAMSVHASSALEILFQIWGEWRTRIVGAVVVSAVLGLALYAPAAWFLTRLADPRVIEMAAEPFQGGDVVLCNQWAYWRTAPQVGDVVRYTMHSVDLGNVAEGNRVVRIRGGDGIDRILAQGGDEVSWENGRLSVNGHESSFKPLNPARLPATMSLTVPDGHYLIAPSIMPYLSPQTGVSLWASVSFIPARSIHGKVYLRHQPLWRLWVIR
jgi:hypothetical protein